MPVDAIKHKDARTNIPTRELAAFAGDDERAPQTVLYPRDPSLDPQLVWKGKDEQDRQPLEVPAVPIYIQEKIHPQALIEDIRRRAARKSEMHVVQTNTKVIERCLLMTTDPGDLVLDPTCGSGTTAYVAEQWAGVGSPSTPAASPWPWPAHD